MIENEELEYLLSIFEKVYAKKSEKLSPDLALALVVFPDLLDMHLEKVYTEKSEKLSPDLVPALAGLPALPAMHVEMLTQMNHIIVVDQPTSLAEVMQIIDPRSLPLPDEFFAPIILSTSKPHITQIINQSTPRLSSISKHNNKTTLRIKARSNLTTKPKPD